jgi:hypothetical protein
MLPTIESTALARSLYALHRAWTSLWPFNAGRWSFRRGIRQASRIGLFPPCWARLEHGWMLLDPLDYVAGSILVHGDWEPDTAAVLRDRLRPGDSFVDIGANIGYFSLLAAPLLAQRGGYSRLSQIQIPGNVSSRTFGVADTAILTCAPLAALLLPEEQICT